MKAFLKTPPRPAGHPATRKQDTRERKKRFDAAHVKGMAAIRRHDFKEVDEAIKEERAIIKEQAALLPSIQKAKKAKKKATFGTIPVARITAKKSKKKR